MEDCGIVLHENALHRIRIAALVAKVPAEPALLSHEGARLWYLMQTSSFDPEDLAFMAKHCPKKMARLYPSLWKGYMLQCKRKYLPDYVAVELFDRDECIFQQDCERTESKGDAALPVLRTPHHIIIENDGDGHHQQDGVHSVAAKGEQGQQQGYNRGV